MLMEVKNEIKIMLLSVKYNIMRQMLNKTTFLTSILVMLLNNASFILQWIVLFSIKDDVGGYTLRQIVLLWGLASGVFGISHVFFNKAFEMPELIIEGKLDTFLIQPKNVLLSAITSNIRISAIGDIIYAYICLVVYGISIQSFILFTIFIITGGIILASLSTIVGSLSFWIVKGDILADAYINMCINVSTYPGSIFKGITKIILYTVVPMGLSIYLPLDIILKFDILKFICIICFTVLVVSLAFLIFYKGLKRYSSSNLMSSRI